MMDSALRTYLIVSAIDWLMVGFALAAVVRWFDVLVWPALILLIVWVGKDLLLYPSSRRYYESEPPQQRMLGEEGEALCRLDREGFARVHGEIWQVYVADTAAPVAAGASVRVLAVHGMRLLVERVTRP